MPDPKPQSLTAFVTALPAGAFVTHAGFFGPAPVLALGNGEVRIGAGSAQKIVAAHPGGAILTATHNEDGLLTGGDDGRVVITGPDGAMAEIAHEKGRWIDALALREDGALAWAAGKSVRARDGRGEVKSVHATSTVRGLAFLPKGYRLAFTQYNSVGLWFPNAAAEPEMLAWKGAHLDVTFSPDGRFAVSSMQENALHGWRLMDKKDMRMSGYPAKTRSFAWSADGNWLATSGAEACIVWPFQSKEGPMGKSPRECGARPAKVSRVAFHPKTLVVALGYEDGWVMLCRLTDGAELLVRARRDGDDMSAVSALAWSVDGSQLAFGAAGGEAGLLALPG